MNNLTIIGRLTKDPVLRKVPVGGVETSVLNFYIAVDDGFGDYQKTDFFHVTAWRGAADNIAKFMTKGREIAVKGAVHLETYETKNAEGKKEIRSAMSIPRPEGFEFLGRKISNDAPDEGECPFDDAL